MQKIKFRFKAGHVDSFAKLGKLRAVFIDLTNQCNLSCKYCFNYRALQSPPLHLDLELIEKALNSKLAESVKDWFLSGGEPVLYPHLLEALRLFRDCGIGPKIATNGTRLTPELLDTLAGYGVPSVQFSLDTLKPGLHANLTGSRAQDHAAILRNLEYAIESPLRVVVSSVLTKANKREIKEIMAFCFESGVDSYTLYPNVPSEKLNKDLIVHFPEMLELIDDLFSEYSSLSSTKVIDITVPCFSDSSAYTKWKDTFALRLHYCAAAQFALKITSDGRVSACICQDGDSFIIGDLRKYSLDDIWVSEKAQEFRSLYEKIPECSLCSRKDVCRGGCRNNSSLFGSKGIYSLDPYCQYFKSCVE
jgi:radical SAM protein with 4Fe4S-binding SPASM domain